MAEGGDETSLSPHAPMLSCQWEFGTAGMAGANEIAVSAWRAKKLPMRQRVVAFQDTCRETGNGGVFEPW